MSTMHTPENENRLGWKINRRLVFAVKAWFLGFMLATTPTAYASLLQADFDVFVQMSGNGADSGVPLSAELGITIDSNTQTTWTLLNTSLNSSGPNSGGQGVGLPPRIDALFFGLEGFPPLTSSALTMTVDAAKSDSSGWALSDFVGSSGGAGKFTLSQDADNSSNLGVDQQLVFTLTTDAFDWVPNTFFNALDSINGNTPTGWQVAASFQTVDSDGEDSGVATGSYVAGSAGGNSVPPAATIPPAAVPAPASLALLGLGGVLLGWIRRRSWA